MAAIDEFAAQWGMNAGLNPDAWAAGTTYEDVRMIATNPTGSIWGGISDFMQGLGNTAQTFFGVAGDVRAAHDQYHNPQPTAVEYAAYQRSQMMTYALIGGAVIIAVLLLKD